MITCRKNRFDFFYTFDFFLYLKIEKFGISFNVFKQYVCGEYMWCKLLHVLACSTYHVLEGIEDLIFIFTFLSFFPKIPN